MLHSFAPLQADAELARRADDLADEVKAGIDRWGIVTHSSGVRIYAMEVDGFGNFFFGDDANVYERSFLLPSPLRWWPLGIA